MRKVYSISDNKSNQWSSNYNHRYYGHNSNIKYIGSTIKCMDFEPIHYAINLDAISSSIIFSYFDFMFLSMYC